MAKPAKRLFFQLPEALALIARNVRGDSLYAAARLIGGVTPNVAVVCWAGDRVVARFEDTDAMRVLRAQPGELPQPKRARLHKPEDYALGGDPVPEGMLWMTWDDAKRLMPSDYFSLRSGTAGATIRFTLDIMDMLALEVQLLLAYGPDAALNYAYSMHGSMRSSQFAFAFVSDIIHRVTLPPHMYAPARLGAPAVRQMVRACTGALLCLPPDQRERACRPLTYECLHTHVSKHRTLLKAWEEYRVHLGVEHMVIPVRRYRAHGHHDKLPTPARLHIDSPEPSECAYQLYHPDDFAQMVLLVAFDKRWTRPLYMRGAPEWLRDMWNAMGILDAFTPPSEP